MRKRKPAGDAIYTVIVCAARCDEGQPIQQRANKTMSKVGALYFCPACIGRASEQYALWDLEGHDSR